MVSMKTSKAKGIFPTKKKSSVLSILPKLRETLGTTDVEGVVKKAITGDAGEALSLFKSIRISVCKSTILDSVIKHCEELGDENVKLDKSMLSVFNDHFRLLGADSALSQITTLCSKIGDLGKGVRSLTVLLAHILETVNILGSEKLRNGALSAVAPVTLKLWGAERKEESCMLTLELFHIIVSERDYLDKSDAIEQWKQFGFLEESLLTSPFMRTLSLLLSTEINDVTIVDTKTLTLMSDQNNGEVKQLVILWGTHLAALSSYEMFDDVVYFLINYHTKQGTISALVPQLLDCFSLCFAFGSTLSRAVVNAVCRTLGPHIQRKDPIVIKLLENTNWEDKPKSKMAKKVLSDTYPEINIVSLVALLQNLDDIRQEDMIKITSLLVSVLSAKSQDAEVVVACLHTLQNLFSRHSSELSLPTDVARVLSKSNILNIEIAQYPCLLSHTISLIVCSCTSLFSTFSSAVKNIPSAGWGDSERATVAAVFCRAATHKEIAAKMIDWSFVNTHVDRLSKKLVGSQSASLLSAISKWGKEQREMLIDTDIISAKRRGKIVEIAFLMATLPDIVEVPAKRAAIAFFANNASTFMNGKEAYIERLLDWNILSSLCSLDPTLLEPIANKALPSDIVTLLESFPSVDETLVANLAVVRSLLSVRLQGFSARLCSSLTTILSHSLDSNEAVGIAAQALAAVGAPMTSVSPFVTLVLAIAVHKSHLDLEFDNASAIASSLHQKELLLLNALRYTPSAVLSDQCALYAELFGIHLRQVATFCTAFPSENEYVHRLQYGCERVIMIIAKHSSYFEKVIPGVMSSCVLSWESVPLPSIRLCSIMERQLSACLATNLPPAEKRAFSRLMDYVKKANKRIV